MEDYLGFNTWLTQKAMARILGTSQQNISVHIRNILKKHEDYNKVFGYLRDNLDECVIPKERLVLYVSRIDEIIKKMKINKSKVNTTTRKLKYVSKYIMNRNNSFFAIKELFNIENYILSNVIKSFVNGKQEDEIASFWHKVIY